MVIIRESKPALPGRTLIHSWENFVNKKYPAKSGNFKDEWLVGQIECFYPMDIGETWKATYFINFVKDSGAPGFITFYADAFNNLAKAPGISSHAPGERHCWDDIEDKWIS